MRISARRFVIALFAGLLFAVSVGTGPVHADGPGSGAAWVVTVGDSYISGEAGRWAGNTNDGAARIDALGPTAYYDNPAHSAEQIAHCHRSRSAEAYIGVTSGYNLACSGAKVATRTDSGEFKPGLDFYSSGGKQGQALMLQHFAATHNVKMVAVSIGGNDFNFGSVVQQCVVDFLTSPTWLEDFCNDDSSVTANFTPANVATRTAAIAQGLRNVRQAMRNAGYADSAYKIVVQNYPSPIPLGSAIRYPESGFTRQTAGGCGFWNEDAHWANTVALPTINNAVANAIAGSGLNNVVLMNVSTAFDTRRLCENTVGLLEEKHIPSWRTVPASVDETEWINDIRTVTTIGTDFYVQESLHPNFWGQSALRNCLRQAYNGGAPHGGRCTIDRTGVNTRGEPNMILR